MTILRRLMQRFRRTPRRLSSVDAYARWAARYPAQAHNPLMETEQAAMLALVPDLRNAVVLDLACGTGRYARLAAERGARQVVGIDNSYAMLQAAVVPGIALAPTEQLPLASGSVDVVLCGLALGHLPRLAPSFWEMSRVLKPGGIALVSDFHPYQYLQGARRIFQGSDGKHYEVEHYPHLHSDYLYTSQQAHLTLVTMREPTLFGKAPVVLVMKFQKAAQRTP